MKSGKDELLRLLVGPLVRFCLREGYLLGDIVQALKLSFVHEAEQLLEARAEKSNLSRLSMMTGVHRKDVKAISKENTIPPRQLPDAIARILSTWEQAAVFTTKRNKPKTLTYEGDSSEFHQLVASVSTDLSPLATLQELERRGLVERRGKRIHFKGALLPLEENYFQGMELLGRDIDSLLTAVSNNLAGEEATKNLHIRTEYDNIDPKTVPTIRKWLLKRGREFHKEMRAYLSKFDQDLTASDSGDDKGARVSVTAFSLTSE